MVDTGQSRAPKTYTRVQLAQAVGRSRQQLDEYRRKGCPMTTPAAVQEWMQGHVKRRHGGPKTVGEQMASKGIAQTEGVSDRVGWLDAFDYFLRHLHSEVARLAAELPAIADEAERVYRHRWLHDELRCRAKGLMSRAADLEPLPDKSLMSAADQLFEDGTDSTTQPPTSGNE